MHASFLTIAHAHAPGSEAQTEEWWVEILATTLVDEALHDGAAMAAGVALQMVGKCVPGACAMLLVHLFALLVQHGGMGAGVLSSVGSQRDKVLWAVLRVVESQVRGGDDLGDARPNDAASRLEALGWEARSCVSCIVKEALVCSDPALRLQALKMTVECEGLLSDSPVSTSSSSSLATWMAPASSSASVLNSATEKGGVDWLLLRIAMAADFKGLAVGVRNEMMQELRKLLIFFRIAHRRVARGLACSALASPAILLPTISNSTAQNSSDARSTAAESTAMHTSPSLPSVTLLEISGEDHDMTRSAAAVFATAAEDARETPRERQVLEWIGATVASALCPEAGTSVSRKSGALELLSTALDVWVPRAAERIDARLHSRQCFSSHSAPGGTVRRSTREHFLANPTCRCPSDPPLPPTELSRAPTLAVTTRACMHTHAPLYGSVTLGDGTAALYSRRIVKGLLAAVLHSFDRVRQRAAALLVRLARVVPEAGLLEDEVAALLALGELLTTKSARTHDADSGALVIQLSALCFFRTVNHHPLLASSSAPTVVPDIAEGGRAPPGSLTAETIASSEEVRDDADVHAYARRHTHSY